MNTYSAVRTPAGMAEFRPAETVRMAFIKEPFEIETASGRRVKVGPQSMAGWDGGCYLVYSVHDSEPIPMSAATVSKHYVPV